MKIDLELAEEARFALHARIVRCPLGGNPPDCPFHDIRMQPVEERVAWLESRDDEQVLELYRQHNACLECKLDKYEL